jgi:hypothetical protein
MSNRSLHRTMDIIDGRMNFRNVPSSNTPERMSLNVDDFEKYSILWDKIPNICKDKYFSEDITKLFEMFVSTKMELARIHDEIAKKPKYTRKDPKEVWKPRYLCLSGGGAKGAYLGSILWCLENYHLLDDVQGVAATSIGALIAGLYMVGYTFREILDIGKLN